MKGVGSQPGHGSPKAKALLKAQEYGFRERGQASTKGNWGMILTKPNLASWSSSSHREKTQSDAWTR